MAENLFFEIHKDLPREGPGRDKYTRRAFCMLPQQDKPRILDIGCGPGGSTMELARIGKGEVIGIDIHQPYLDRLSQKIQQAEHSHRVKAIHFHLYTYVLNRNFSINIIFNSYFNLHC